MADMNDVSSMNCAGRKLTREEEIAKIEAILDETIPGESETEADRKKRKEAIQNQLYTILTVKRPAPVLFEADMLSNGKMVFKLNVNHPFYQKVIGPLGWDALEEESPEDVVNRKQIRDAILLLLMSFAKAKAGIQEVEGDTSSLDQLEERWGVILNAVMNKTKV